MNGTELVRLADLILLSAQTAKIFSDTKENGNGYVSRITQLAQQIELAATELRKIGMATAAPETLDP